MAIWHRAKHQHLPCLAVQEGDEGVIALESRAVTVETNGSIPQSQSPPMQAERIAEMEMHSSTTINTFCGLPLYSHTPCVDTG